MAAIFQTINSNIFSRMKIAGDIFIQIWLKLVANGPSRKKNPSTDHQFGAKPLL